MSKQELHPRTAVINKQQKNKSKKARLDALSWLALTYPQAFDNSLKIRPLKKGILKDLMLYSAEAVKAGISKSKLREAVVVFTRRLDYLTCLKAKEIRIDLEGNSTEVVTNEEAEYAAAKIKKRIEKGLRNARKLMSEKNQTPFNKASATQTSYLAKHNAAKSAPLTEDYLHAYSDKMPAYGSTSSTATRAAVTLVKHKTVRQYDPDAVARLKEKLGLSREEKKETAE